MEHMPMLFLLMTWWHHEPGHQQVWYCPKSAGCKSMSCQLMTWCHQEEVRASEGMVLNKLAQDIPFLTWESSTSPQRHDTTLKRLMGYSNSVSSLNQVRPYRQGRFKWLVLELFNDTYTMQHGYDGDFFNDLLSGSESLEVLLDFKANLKL